MELDPALQRGDAQPTATSNNVPSGDTTNPVSASQQALQLQQQQQLQGNARNGQNYRTYTEEAMAAAVKAILEDGLSLRQSSARFKVPKSTLSERLGDKKPWLDPNRPKNAARPNVTRYKWSEADMEKALATVNQQTANRGATVANPLTISEAAKQHGVPASALNARYRGRTPRSLKGSQSSLTLKQETLLADWARAQAELGFPANKDQVYALAERVFLREHPDRVLGRQWVAHWMRRYAHVKVLDWKRPDRTVPPPPNTIPAQYMTQQMPAPQFIEYQHHGAAGDVEQQEAVMGQGEMQEQQQRHQMQMQHQQQAQVQMQQPANIGQAQGQAMMASAYTAGVFQIAGAVENSSS